jgi:hypothetical protein
VLTACELSALTCDDMEYQCPQSMTTPALTSHFTLTFDCVVLTCRDKQGAWNWPAACLTCMMSARS